jgi:hypothetical protein
MVSGKAAEDLAKTVAVRAEPADGGVPAERRLELLEGVPAFACLPTPALEELAEQLEEDHYPPGAVIVAEGEAGDRLYLIAEGRAEVSTAGQNGPVPLATLGPGELFGEIALLEPGSRRQATVTATTPLLTLSLAAPYFRQVLDAHQEARTVFSEAVQALLTAKFLKPGTRAIGCSSSCGCATGRARSPAWRRTSPTRRRLDVPIRVLFTQPRRIQPSRRFTHTGNASSVLRWRQV